ncbi:MAG: oligosaccharide flippase family protein [Oscillospiraceae bacterium]|nr:oligosaccharide flippase family protein [Oscillospiraceae bacterium]
MRRGRQLLYNTLLLTGAAMFMRAVAVSFQVYLAGVIGPAGIGLFQLIVSAQMLALTVAVSGIRFATTRLVSEELGLHRPGNVPRVMRRCIAHAVGFGTLAGAFLFFGAEWIGTAWIGDVRTVLSLRILSLSLPFVACTAAMNGYFVAVSRVIKSASVQVFEHLTRIVVVVTLLALYPPNGLEMACALVVIGGVTAEILSSLVLFGLYLHDKRRGRRERQRRDDVGIVPYEGQGLTRRLLGISMPLAASTYARSALNTLQHMLVPRGLRRSGADGDEALSSYGMVHGMALPITLFPSAMFYAAAELMIPELTAAQVAGNRERISYLVSKLLRISLYLSIGLAGLFLAFSSELGQVIYPGTPGVGPYIRILALLMPVMFLDAITDGMLKGLGQQVYSMGVNIADSLLSVALVWVLLPMFGVGGFIFMVYFTECFNFLLSLRRIAQMTTIRVAVSDLVKPVLSAAAATQLMPLLLRGIGLELTPSAGSLAAHFVLTGAVYVGLLFVLGCVTSQDLRWARRLVGAGASPGQLR